MRAYSDVVGEGGFEPPKSVTTDLQSAPFDRSGIPPYEIWSWWTDSNPRPADYKSAALPAELHQQFQQQNLSYQISACLSTENFCFSTRFFHFAGGAHETCRDLYTGKEHRIWKQRNIGVFLHGPEPKKFPASAAAGCAAGASGGLLSLLRRGAVPL